MVDKDPLISVIVPVFNVEKYLPRCLQAIAEQTYRNLEIILVDDGSTDNSGQICEEYAAKDTRARVIHQANMGLWAARNTGHDAAQGDYLFFPDADDYFHRDLIRLLLLAINDGKGYDLAICRINKTSNGNEDVSSPKSVCLKEVDRDDLFRNMFREKTDDPFSIFMWNKLFRRRLIEGFRTNPYARSQDKDYMMRLYLHLDRAALIESRLYFWRQRKDSLTHSWSNLFLYNECRTRMCFRNLSAMTGENSKYAHYLLEEMYVRLLFWRNMSWNKPTRNVIVSECKTIVEKTAASYLKCREISPCKRLVCLFMARHPHLSHWLMVLSGN